MTLYRLSVDARKNIVGYSPQLYFDGSLNPEYHINKDYSLDNIESCETINEPIVFPIFKMHEKAKYSDYLSYTGPGCTNFKIWSQNIDSENLKFDQFEKRKIVIDDHSTNQYEAVFFKNYRDIIDWKNTTFAISRISDYRFEGMVQVWKEIKEITFQNNNEYLDWTRQFGGYSGDSLVCNIKALTLIKDIRWDIFKSSSPLHGIYCKENFMNYVQERKLTGFAFKVLVLNNLANYES